MSEIIFGVSTGETSGSGAYEIIQASSKVAQILEYPDGTLEYELSGIIVHGFFRIVDDKYICLNKHFFNKFAISKE